MAGNQYQPDPRQSLFLQYYLDFKSETFSNALQSALRAGYSQEYSENITSEYPEWLSEALGDNKCLRKAEKVLDDILDMAAVDEDGKVDNTLLGTQVKVATLYAKGLGKAKYSERVEQTGANGAPLVVTFDSSFKNDSTRPST